MKKIIFLISVISLIIIVSSIIPIKEKEEKVFSNGVKLKTKNKIIKKDELYVSEVPKVDQEYTLSISNNNNDEQLNTEVYDSEIIVEEEKENNDEIIAEDVENLIIEDEESQNISQDYVTEENKDEVKEELNDNLIENEKKEDIEVHYLKNGFYEEDSNTYYYENDNKVTGLKVIDGVNNYFSPSGKYLGVSKVKVIDVSYYQKDINWDLFASDSDCYGVILRLGYYTTLDKRFERNLSEVKRLNIPYGIYLFSYATSIDGARREAEFTNDMIDKYDIKPTLGIYYDLESWKTKSSSSDNISKNGYNYIANGYIESVSNHINNAYEVGIYSGRWYAMNRLGKTAKSYVNWVAEYNNTLKYDSTYKMWQYTSKGSVPGIDGYVDISYLY